GRHVDVVDADARAADHLHPPRALDQVGGELGGGADDDRVVVADPVRQLAVLPVDADVHVEVLAQEVDAGVGELLLYEYPRAVVHAGVAAGTPASRKTPCAAPTPVPRSTGWPSSRSV